MFGTPPQNSRTVIQMMIPLPWMFTLLFTFPHADKLDTHLEFHFAPSINYPPTFRVPFVAFSPSINYPASCN